MSLSFVVVLALLGSLIGYQQGLFRVLAWPLGALLAMLSIRQFAPSLSDGLVSAGLLEPLGAYLLVYLCLLFAVLLSVRLLMLDLQASSLKRLPKLAPWYRASGALASASLAILLALFILWAQGFIRAQPSQQPLIPALDGWLNGQVQRLTEGLRTQLAVGNMSQLPTELGGHLATGSELGLISEWLSRYQAAEQIQWSLDESRAGLATDLNTAPPLASPARLWLDWLNKRLPLAAGGISDETQQIGADNPPAAESPGYFSIEPAAE